MCATTFSGPWITLEPLQRRRLAEALRSRGLHMTEQREAICEAIFGCPGHICAEHILEVVVSHKPALKLNKTTVYRMLDVLLDLRLVTEHRIGDGPTQYESAHRGHHAHLICHLCGRGQDLDEDLEASIRHGIRALYRFEADLEAYPIFGVCAACRN